MYNLRLDLSPLRSAGQAYDVEQKDKRMSDEAEINEWCEGMRNFSRIHFQEIPESGVIDLTCPMEPISYQRSSRLEKDLIKQCLQAQTSEFPLLITDDVQVEIEWKINDRNRYESPGTPDSDNIIKPILDSLIGYNGILLDDCQVDDVRSYCMGGWVSGHNRFDIKIYLPSRSGLPVHSVKKSGLKIVHLGRALCIPIDVEADPTYELIILRQFITYLANRTDDDFDQELMPFRRIFHKSRVREYPCLEVEEAFQLLGTKSERS